MGFLTGDMEDLVISDVMNDVRKIPWKFCDDIFIGSVLGRGGPRRGVLGGR